MICIVEGRKQVQCYFKGGIAILACWHGMPETCQYLHEHIWHRKSTVNLHFLSLTSNPASPFHKTWQYCVLCLILLNFLIMFGHTAIVHMSLLLLFSWILLVTWILMSSNIVMTGLNLDSIIQLLKDSLMLLSTDSQFEPSLNQARDQWTGSVFSKSSHPRGVFAASLFL